jgi:adenylate cyclase
MEQKLVTFNEERSKEGKVPIRMGIGIHTGQAIVGDIGAPHRREFTAIGSAVNVASRLEGMTKEVGRSIVVSESTARLVPDVSWDELGQYPIRGCAEPLPLFAPKA